MPRRTTAPRSSRIRVSMRIERRADRWQLSTRRRTSDRSPPRARDRRLHAHAVAGARALVRDLARRQSSLRTPYAELEPTAAARTCIRRPRSRQRLHAAQGRRAPGHLDARASAARSARQRRRRAVRAQVRTRVPGAAAAALGISALRRDRHQPRHDGAAVLDRPGRLDRLRLFGNGHEHGAAARWPARRARGDAARQSDARVSGDAVRAARGARAPSPAGCASCMRRSSGTSSATSPELTRTRRWYVSNARCASQLPPQRRGRCCATSRPRRSLRESALASRSSGAGIGAVRTMYIAGTWGDGYTGGAEVYVKERLESYDENERCMTYRLVDAGPLPFADYLGSARLVCAGPDRCIAVMTSAFVPVEMDDEAAAALSRGSIDLALANLRAAAERRDRVARDAAARQRTARSLMHTTLFDQFPREIVCRHAIRLPVDADRAWSLVGDFGDARVGAEFVDRIDVEGMRRRRRAHAARQGRDQDPRATRGVLGRRIVTTSTVSSIRARSTSRITSRWRACSRQDRTNASSCGSRRPRPSTAKHDEMRQLLDGNIQMVFAAVRRELGDRLAAELVGRARVSPMAVPRAAPSHARRARCGRRPSPAPRGARPATRAARRAVP